METTPNPFDHAVCLSVTLRRFGTQRQVPAAAVETDADRRLLHLSKTILDCQALQAIGQLDTAIRRYLQSRCLVNVLFRPGLYLLPEALIPEVDTRLQQFADQRAQLVDTLCAGYASEQEQIRIALGSLYDPLDYPAPEAFRACFGMDLQYLTVSVPRLLERVSQQLFAREEDKARTQITEVAERIEEALLAGLKETIDHLVDRLTPGPDGKPKTFRASLLAHAQDFFTVFKERNLTGRLDLNDLAERAQQVLAGVEPQALRTSDALRTLVEKGFREIQSQLDAAIIPRPIRQIRFDEEEDRA